MTLYTGFDLHSNNNYLGTVDSRGKRIFKRRLRNQPEQILNTLNPYQHDIAGIVVESTYNWYWLVDLLMEHGYKVHLANPSGSQPGRRRMQQGVPGCRHGDAADNPRNLICDFYNFGMGVVPKTFLCLISACF